MTIIIPPLSPFPGRGAAPEDYIAQADTVMQQLPATIAGIQAVSDAFNLGTGVLSTGYLPPVAYAAGITMKSALQTVQRGEVTYAPLLDRLPFVTGTEFDATAWRVVQGVTRGDLARPDGGDIIGFGDRTVDAKLAEITSVVDNGAIGDGVTSAAAAFTAMESSTADSFYVPAGVYRSQALALKKTYHGPGTILLGSGAEYDAGGCTGGLGDVNVGTASAPRSIVLISDSIGYGAGVTAQQTWYGLLQKRLGRKMPRGLGDYISGSCLDCMVLVSGPALLPGTSGPLGGNLADPGSKIFSVGTKTAVLASNADFLQFWYWRKPGAGTITVKDTAGRVVGVQNCAGVDAPVILSATMPIISSADTLFTFECSVAPVELNGLMISPLILNGESTPLVLMAHFKGGFGTRSFTSDAVIDAIVAQTPYRSGTTKFLLALGPNDIYNLFGQAVSAAQYGANLNTIITKLKNRMSCIFDIIVPLRPDGVYRVIEEFDNYRREAYHAARATGSKLIDASTLDLISTGSYQADKLHPTPQGHAMYADFYDTAAGLSRLDVEIYRGPVVLGAGVTNVPAPAGIPVARLAPGGNVTHCGVAGVAGLAAGAVIATQSLATSPRYRVMRRFSSYSPGDSSGNVMFEPDGRIVLFSFSGAGCDYVDFNGLSYNIYD